MSWSEGRAWRAGRAGPLLAVLALLGGCGFQFRGAPAFPPQMAVTHVAAEDRYSPFYRELVAVLRRSDIQLTDDPSAARTVIRTSVKQPSQRVADPAVTATRHAIWARAFCRLLKTSIPRSPKRSSAWTRRSRRSSTRR